MSERDDLFSRLQSLIATAVHKNTPTEEARTAAVLAVRLAVENGFIHKTMPVSADPAPPRPHVAQKPVAPPVRPAVQVPRPTAPAAPRVTLRDRLRARGANISSPPPQTAVRVAQAVPTRSPPRSSIFNGPAGRRNDEEKIKIRARFGAPCLECDSYVNEGEEVYWYKGSGIVHVDCDLPF